METLTDQNTFANQTPCQSTSTSMFEEQFIIPRCPILNDRFTTHLIESENEKDIRICFLYCIETIVPFIFIFLEKQNQKSTQTNTKKKLMELKNNSDNSVIQEEGKHT